MNKTMKLYAVILVVATLAVIQAGAIPKKEEKHGKDRIYDKELTDTEHFEEEEHNPEYDHEAFLGKEESHSYDNLSPEESKERLGKIYDKIDKDNNGLVTEEELKDWIQYVQRRYIVEDTERQWKEMDPEDDSVSWEAYKKRTYGFMEDDDNDNDDDTYKDMIKRDERRWKKADKNSDGKLTKDEYADFLHPEESDHMRDIVVDETLEDIDKDKDGSISLEEYIGDMWPNKDGGEEEPEWLATEREQFNSFRDKNKDGKMDRDEVREWIVPPDYDHSEAEAKHLIQESDQDKDGGLTRAEVLEKYDIFVGSQATDFGEALARHDEF